jgi:four helix bundle suffix protein
MEYPLEQNPWTLEVAEAAADYRRIRPGGGYRSLRSFQTTTLIYDGTSIFCDQWISKRSRTHDQMVQAARSGRQNIAEGSRASTTSSSSELLLTNVARASLDELLLDYEDVLRQRKFPQWEADEDSSQVVRKLFRQIDAVNREVSGLSHRKQDDARWGVYAAWLESQDLEKQANTLICLIHQANYLLDQQIRRLEKDFLKEGGLRERMTKARLQAREQQRRDEMRR